MNDQLIKELKERMPDFNDTKKLENLEARTTKMHKIESRYTKQVFNNFAQALAEIETKLKAKYKLAPELCKALSGTFVIVFELPASESKKILEQALRKANEEYQNLISNQQDAWLSEQLEEVLQEQAKKNEEKEQKATADFKASLLKALKTD